MLAVTQAEVKHTQLEDKMQQKNIKAIIKRTLPFWLCRFGDKLIFYHGFINSWGHLFYSVPTLVLLQLDSACKMFLGTWRPDAMDVSVTHRTVYGPLSGDDAKTYFCPVSQNDM